MIEQQNQETNGIQQLLKVPDRTSVQWREFNPTQFPQVAFCNELTPFWGTPQFAKLSELQKNKLFWGYLQMTAESIVFLEIILVAGFARLAKQLRSKNISQDNEALLLAIDRLREEEKLHTRGYVRFLKSSSELKYRNEKVFLGPQIKGLKRKMLWLCYQFPACLALPGAKVEAFATLYGKYLRELHNQDGKANAWVYVNYLHMLDEVHHVPFQFDFYATHLQSRTLVYRLFNVLATLGFVICLQFCLLAGAKSLVRKTFPELNFFSRWLMMLQLGKWIVREFQPYKETLKMTKRFFLEKKPFGFRFLSFMHR